MNSIDIFGSLKSQANSNTVLGTRLSNMKNSVCPYTQQVISVNSNDTVNVNQATSFGLSLLNVSTLNGLVGLINSADSKVEVIDSATGEINFTLDNALKLSVKNAYTEVLNELRSLNINPLTDLEYSLGTYNKRWNNIYGNKIVDCQAIRSGGSSIPFMQNTNVSTASGQNVLWQHTTNESTPTNFQLLIETKDINTNFERMQVASYRNAYRNLHLQPSGKVLIGGDYSAINNSTISTLDVNGNTTVRGHITPDTTNSKDLGASGTRFRTLYTTDVSVNGNIYSATTATPLIFAQDTTEKMRVSSTGNIQIGGATNLTDSLMISNGNIGINSRNDGSGIAKITFYQNPWVDGTQYPTFLAGKTAIIAQAFSDWSKSKLHFCLNNTSDGTTSATVSDARMTILPTGNVGINTTTPGQALDVRSASGSTYIQVGGPVASAQGFAFRDDTALRYSFYKASNTGDLRFFNFADSKDGVLTLTSGSLVGINTTNPSTTLDVNGTTTVRNILPDSTTNNRDIGSSSKIFKNLFVNTIGSLTNPVASLYADVWSNSSTNGLRCSNNLVLASDLSLPTITWYDTNVKSMILVDTVNTQDGGKLSYDSANSEIVIGTTSTSAERVRIGANGIKTSVNILPTDANRNIGSSTAKFNTIYTSTILNPDSNLILGRGTTSTIVISTTGMSIASGGNPTEALDVTGNIKVSGNILPNVHNVPSIGTSNTNRFLAGYFGTVYGGGVALTSDRRLKEEIKPITNGLETVLRMKPVEYKMKGRVRLHTGFLADEMRNLYNGEDWACFVEDQDEFKTQSLQYTEVVAVLTSAIQELNEKVNNTNNNNYETEIIRPTLHRCIEISRINELYDRISSIEAENISHQRSWQSLKNANNELSVKLDEVNYILQSKPKAEQKVEIEESDSGGITMVESLQERLYKAEQLISKQDKMIKKLTTAVNKLLKEA